MWLLIYKTQQCPAGCTKDFRKVRSHGWQCRNVSLVSRTQDKLCGVYLGLLTHCQTADVSLAVVPLEVTSSLSGFVCEYMCLGGQGAGSNTLHTSRRCPLFIRLETKDTHTNTKVLATIPPFTISHFALLTHCRIPSKFLLKDNTLLLSMKRLGAV